MKPMKNPALAMGDIIRAWVPFDESPKVAGPKFRPVIFLGETQIDGLTSWVVAYGTTKMEAHKESKNGGDFFVRITDDRSGVLHGDSRFDFNRVFALPATAEFFALNKKETTLRVAKLPQHLFQRAAEAMQYAKVGQALRRLGVRLE
jgi:hypothetical protein